jgi:hypothetical protein
VEIPDAIWDFRLQNVKTVEKSRAARAMEMTYDRQN